MVRHRVPKGVRTRSRAAWSRYVECGDTFEHWERLGPDGRCEIVDFFDPTGPGSPSSQEPSYYFDRRFSLLSLGVSLGAGVVAAAGHWFALRALRRRSGGLLAI